MPVSTITESTPTPPCLTRATATSTKTLRPSHVDLGGSTNFGMHSGPPSCSGTSTPSIGTPIEPSFLLQLPNCHDQLCQGYESFQDHGVDPSGVDEQRRIADLLKSLQSLVVQTYAFGSQDDSRAVVSRDEQEACIRSLSDSKGGLADPGLQYETSSVTAPGACKPTAKQILNESCAHTLLPQSSIDDRRLHMHPMITRQRSARIRRPSVASLNFDASGFERTHHLASRAVRSVDCDKMVTASHYFSFPQIEDDQRDVNRPMYHM